LFSEMKTDLDPF